MIGRRFLGLTLVFLGLIVAFTSLTWLTLGPSARVPLAMGGGLLVVVAGLAVLGRAGPPEGPDGP